MARGGGGGGAVAAGLRLRHRGGGGGRGPAGEAAAVRGDGDAQPLLLLPPRKPGAPGSPPAHRSQLPACRPCLRALRVLCSDSFGVVLCCAELDAWIGRVLVRECDSVFLECEYGLG